MASKLVKKSDMVEFTLKEGANLVNMLHGEYRCERCPWEGSRWEVRHTRLYGTVCPICGYTIRPMNNESIEE